MNTRTGFAVAVALVTALALFGVAPNASAQLTRGCNLPKEFPCPAARIMDFSADKTSIKPGESIVVSWVAENPGVMEVTPDIGVVVARGSARITPSATTTYMLKVGGGPDGQTLTRTLTITVAGTTARAAPTEAAGGGGPRPVPRTADGKPLLQGVYNMFGAMRGGGPGGLRAGGSPAAAPLAPGELPRQPTLKAGMESYRAPPRDPTRMVVSDCVIGSVPPSIGPYSIQIIQNPDYIVLFYEYMHLHRIIPMDGQPHQPGVSWMGDSIGSWDGDTLVVDTIGFNTLSTVGPGGDRHLPYKHSSELHMVERFRRTDSNTLEWETTLEDPKVFEGPWRTTTRLAFHPELKKVDEYQCAENVKNYEYLVNPNAEIKMNPN